MKNIYGKIIHPDVLELYKKFVYFRHCKNLHVDIKRDIAALVIILAEIDKSQHFVCSNSPLAIIRGMLLDAAEKFNKGRYEIGVWRVASPIALNTSTEHFIDIAASNASAHDNIFYTYKDIYFDGLPGQESKALVKKWQSRDYKNLDKERIVSLKKQCDSTIERMGLPKVSWRRIDIHVWR